MRRATAPLLLTVLLCWGASGCSNQQQGASPFVFDRPGEVALVCYDGNADEDDEYLVLPLSCCYPSRSADDPAYLHPPADEPPCPFPEEEEAPDAGATVAGHAPTLHALVTQTARGEVAAVDLEASRTLDSAQQIPGYSFIDVGALPVALVVPDALPDDGSGSLRGPAWTYVASAGEQAVVAVPTCRFKLGRACPELVDVNAVRRVPLPSTPADMVLGPSRDALWVSLPESGALARVPLSTSGSEPFAIPVEGGADGGADAGGGGVPGDGGVDGGGPASPRPELFRLTSAAEVAPPSPQPEDTTYRAVCGLDYAYEPFEADVPTAPVQPFDPAVDPAPSHLRFDARSGLLLAADANQPVLHALAIEGDRVALRATLSVGAPLRDFALTPEVPASAPELDRLFGPPVAEEYAPESTKRYLYAIDDRDGSVMVFSFSLGGQTPVLTPLVAPPGQRTYLDRLGFARVAMALDVVDTRPLEPWICGDDPESPHWEGDPPRNDDEVVRDRVETIEEAAGPGALRGVFVVIAFSNGALAVVDVHDLDLHCRAQAGCARCDNDDSCTDEEREHIAPSGESGTQSLALVRHAPRLQQAGRALVRVTGEDDLAPLEAGCPEGYYQGFPEDEGEALVCVPSDPWQVESISLSTRYEAALPGLSLVPVQLEAGPEEGTLIAHGPVGIDFCERGVAAELNPEGDLLAVLSDPSEGSGDCPSVRPGDEETFRVVDAYRDRLIIEAEGEAAQRLLACYPELVDVQVRAGSQYVLGEFLYSRVTGDADGRCMVDAARDEGRTLRARGGELYESTFAAFQPVDAMDPESVRATISIAATGSVVLSSAVDVGSPRADSLPIQVRYFPETGELFIVDQASQGLRRFGLSPFGAREGSDAFR